MSDPTTEALEIAIVALETIAMPAGVETNLEKGMREAALLALLQIRKRVPQMVRGTS